MAVSSRRLLLAGGLLTALGLAVAGTAPVLGTEGSDHTQGRQAAAGVVVLVGWAALAWGIHRFGRESGSDGT
jgi:hypothetical protein